MKRRGIFIYIKHFEPQHLLGSSWQAIGRLKKRLAVTCKTSWDITQTNKVINAQLMIKFHNDIISIFTALFTPNSSAQEVNEIFKRKDYQ